MCPVFQAEKAIRDVEKELVELQECTKLFDVTVPDYRDIKLCRRDIVVLKELWDIVALMQVKGLVFKKKTKQTNAENVTFLSRDQNISTLHPRVPPSNKSIA